MELKEIFFLKYDRWKYFILSIVGLCLASGFIRIFNALPWFDEVYFADITHSLINDNALSLNLLLSPVEATAYGPVYFYTQKFICSLFGFGMWQFRLLNLTSGVALIIIFLTISKRLNLSKLNSCILIALIAFDPQFNFNMTSGRMDLFALTLFMIGWLLFINIERRTYLLLILSGIISSLSFLTTPRIGFYFLVYILTFILEFITGKNRNKTFFHYLVLGLSILVPVLSWIYYSYGNLSNYIDFIFYNPAIAYHYGSTIFPVKYQVPLIILWFLSGVYVLKSKVNILNPLLTGLFFISFFHLIFIKEVGPYSAMMMPFIYLGIVIGVNSIPARKFSLVSGILALYLFLFSLSSSFNNIASSFNIIGSIEILKPASFKTFFKSQGIINKNILADFPYYYFITENDNRFISFYNTKNELTENSLNSSNIEFAVISNENFNKNSELFMKLGFNVITEYSSKKAGSFLYKISIYLKKNIRTGYDGVILKRKFSTIQ